MAETKILDEAMKEIKLVLDKYDVGAVVIIHRPNINSSFIKVDTGYSVSSIDDQNRIKIEPDANKFPTPEATITGLKDTSNLFMHLSRRALDIGNWLLNASQNFDKGFKAKHGDFKAVE